MAQDVLQNHGNSVPAGYRFDQAIHPKERGVWNMAALAYDHIEGTDIQSVLADLDE